MQGLQIFLIVSLGIILVSSCPYGGDQPAKRLIKTSAEEPAKWLVEEEVFKLIEKHVNFIDITDHNFPDKKPEDFNTKAIPTFLQYNATVRDHIRRINTPRMEEFIRTFSSYHTRYYTSQTGVQSEQWLLGQVEASVQGYKGNVTVREFIHFWEQNSIIARIEGSDPVLKNEVVIMGAHQDSVSLAGSGQNAPGADDNASGSVTVLETLRIFVESGFAPKRTLEFHWYAAEEVGLLGSADIARSYYENNVNVVSMVNFDVTGYYSPGNDVIGIFTDNVNPALTQFMRLITDGYLTFGWRNRSCGYGCSDHVSWLNYGFPSAFPSEVVFHPQMHTTGDNFASVTFVQVNEFVKLALGYAVEMAEPSTL